MKIEEIWTDADRDYAPHRLTIKKRKTLVEDEDRGWRGASGYVHLGESNWQSDISQANPYIKIQVALATLIDQNPTGVFAPSSKKYQATTELMKQLYKRSWEFAKSKQQLKLFTFNLAKYGWACARTYPLRITRTVKVLKEPNQEDPSKSVYEDKEVTEYNDIMRDNLDPWNVWMDDMAKPNNSRSVKDWAWRKVYTMEAAEEEFGLWPNFKYVQPGGIVTDKIDESDKISKKYTSKDLVEVYFYESLAKDMFQVHIGGVPVVMSPLPISDTAGNKKLSLWQTYWNLRHAECPVGIGIYEAIRYDQGILDRIRNMTVDQLTLSIYKMFFYQGTNQLTETGDIKISPGVGKQTLDPKNVNFLEVPGPGKDAYMGIDMFRRDLDEASGITDPLLGNITGKTAFEIAQAKESALKRLKTPLENITDALDTEAYITISLVQLIYSIPETFAITDPELIDAYMKEVQADHELFERGDDGKFTAKVYPEFPLNLQVDENDNLVETNNAQFLRIKPRYLKWEGIISVKSQSVLTPSKQVDKAQDLEMFNILIPLIQPRPNPMTGQDDGPHLYGRIARSMVKLYDKDPKDILPPEWLNEDTQQSQQPQPLIVPTNGQPMAQNGPQAQDMNAQRVVPQTNPPNSPQAIVAGMSGKNSAPFA